MKLSRIGALVALFAVPLVGCAEEEPEIVVEADAPAAADPALVEPMPPAGAGGGMEQMVTMNALNDSGVTGQAVVTPSGSQTQVRVTLNAATSGTHQGHVHQGTCDSPGSVVQPLQPVTVDQGGSGTMTTTVQVDPNTVMNGQHIVVYHEAGGSPGTPVVCGEIPMHQM